MLRPINLRNAIEDENEYSNDDVDEIEELNDDDEHAAYSTAAQKDLDLNRLNLPDLANVAPNVAIYKGASCEPARIDRVLKSVENLRMSNRRFFLSFLGSGFDLTNSLKHVIL